ncbi:MAG: SagB/ThcOx family dehydrogenase [Planctomycetaceae bacterium]|nr:SagB/ThcOx family dehydrogenase [Planctomycetaceae bacterium]
MSERAADLELDAGMGPREDVRRALAYHERTKHHLDRYARSPAFLGWDYQPDPFRTFEGAPAVALPLLADGLTTPFADLFRPGAVAPRPLELGTVALLFELSLGLSAWKQYRGDRWALRCNPSSGNLHPTEGYAVLPVLPGLGAGVYHYVSRDHRLERRCALEGPAAERLAGRLPSGTFLVGLSSIHWREAWKYGERAFRYCQHDAGHALTAVRYAAAALGWSAVLLDAPSDADLAALLGLDRPEDFAGVAPADREHPDAALLVGPPPLRPESLPLPLADWPLGGTWAGRANPLSPSHDPWAAIDEAAEATRKPATPPLEAAPQPPWPPLSPPAPASRLPASTLFRRRRSALAFDGRTAIEAEAFLAMLDRLLPRPDVPPWDALTWPPKVHAGLFVHRVRGLVPGFYLFERDASVHDRLRAEVREDLAWERPPGCPDHLRLFRLGRQDLRDTSRIISCHQTVASHGAFSLGMIADFGDTIRSGGAWWYRRLFWEAGMLGQVLYLEAEAAGVRGTGIGCYFDDAFHDLLGLSGDRFQDLYHFTVGAPVDDPRLTSLPPYGHLDPVPGPA